jgi:hypothetical protein
MQRQALDLGVNICNTYIWQRTCNQVLGVFLNIQKLTNDNKKEITKNFKISKWSGY